MPLFAMFPACQLTCALSGNPKIGDAANVTRVLRMYPARLR